jgi:hypothetical protein
MPLNARYIVPQLLDSDDSDGLHGKSCECYRRYHFGTDALPFFGFATLALFILLLCALLAGLTLAVCSLDIVWLQVMSVTGNQRQRLLSLLDFSATSNKLTTFTGIKPLQYRGLNGTRPGFSVNTTNILGRQYLLMLSWQAPWLYAQLLAPRHYRS